MSEATLDRGASELAPGEVPGASQPPSRLAGELRPHPAPFQYVIIAIILMLVTGMEVVTSYLEGDLPDGAVVGLLLGAPPRSLLMWMAVGASMWSAILTLAVALGLIGLESLG